MNALVIYEDAGTARQAIAMLERASDRAEGTSRWNVKPWRLDLLVWPLLARDALKEAADAELVVWAANGKTEPPPGLLDWLEAWAAGRHVSDAALAIFDGQKEDALSRMASPTLTDFARRFGLSFIFGEVNPAPMEIFWGLPGRTPTQTATSKPISRDPTPGLQRHWGINE